jgi:NAD-dependent deacetylase
MTKPTLVVLTGAGISAESGLKTFRDSDGLWEGYDVHDVATPHAWKRDPQLVLDFYNERRKNIRDAQPNTAHKILAELEQYFDVQIITQNIDDLHERAGSANVKHLHGEIFKMRSELHCHDDRIAMRIEGDMKLGDTAPDGGQLRPHIVWFEEEVPMIAEVIPVMHTADYFLLVGTSLVVYPAAGLVDYVRPEVTKYVVDKRIPPVSHYSNVVAIEKPATEGMAEARELLLAALRERS